MRWLLTIVLGLALAGGWWWYSQRQEAEPLGEIPELDAEQERELSLPEFPDEQADEEDDRLDETLERIDTIETDREPLPDLGESDDEILDALAERLGAERVAARLVDERLIESAVVTINSLDGEAIPIRLRPLRALPGEPEVREEGDALYWESANADRYRPLLDWLDAIPPESAADLYRHYEPLFDEAWSELGEAGRHFRQRLIEIIDHLLGAPRVPAEFEVEPFEAQLEYADESHEAQSWGRKMLMRVGPQQRSAVEDWLREFRRALVDASQR